MLTLDLIKENLNLQNHLYVAYSGGPDSSVLLDLCVKLRDTSNINLSAIHINHNLSKKSIDWENHCVSECKKLNVNLIIESVQINSDGGGLESAARQARYKIFENILKENEQIVLGHHSDDVAETIFMRILRGTGLDGIEGPAHKRNIGQGKLIRPLIRVPKTEIMNYLRDNKLNFIEDDTNEDIRFDRNFLRHKIFPLLEDRWKDFPKRINSLSSISKDRNENYKILVYEKFEQLIGSKIILKDLKKIPKSLAIDVIRYSIKQCNLAIPNSKIMEEIYKTFVASRPGPKSCVTWSRADKEDSSGMIKYKEGNLIISKR